MHAALGGLLDLNVLLVALVLNLEHAATLVLGHLLAHLRDVRLALLVLDALLLKRTVFLRFKDRFPLVCLGLLGVVFGLALLLDCLVLQLHLDHLGGLLLGGEARGLLLLLAALLEHVQLLLGLDFLLGEFVALLGEQLFFLGAGGSN